MNILSNLIPSPEELEKLRKLEIYKTPNIYHLKNSANELLYIGVRHTHSHEDPQLKIIEQNILEFKPNFIIVEGNKGVEEVKPNMFRYFDKVRSQELSIESFVNLRGEMEYTQYLAYTNQINFTSVEPTEAELTTHLIQNGFTLDEIFYYNGSRWLIKFVRIQNQTETLNTFFDTLLNRYLKDKIWSNYTKNLENFKLVEKKLYNLDFDDTLKRYRGVITPTFKESRVAIVVYNYKEIKIIEEIILKLKTYPKILVVYGKSHSLAHEDVLEKWFKKA